MKHPIEIYEHADGQPLPEYYCALEERRSGVVYIMPMKPHWLLSVRVQGAKMVKQLFDAVNITFQQPSIGGEYTVSTHVENQPFEAGCWESTDIYFDVKEY